MARTDTLTNYLTDVASAIKAKKGDNTPIQASSFDTEIANLPSGGGVAKDNDVNFYDYDGTILYSYSASEFANLSEMPSNPTQEGLTAQGWNWELADAKDYVSKYGFIEIGQMYKPSDDKIHLFISLNNPNISPYVCFAVNGTATIEWGDGNSDVVTGTSTSTGIYTQHIYSDAGNYEIKISSDENIYLLANTSSYCGYILTDSTTPNISNVYKDAITKIYLSSNVYINTGSFSRFGNLEYIVIPKDVLGGNFARTFIYCYSLVHINTFFSPSSACFQRCDSLKRVSVCKNTISSNAFSECRSLNKLTMVSTSATTYVNNPSFNDTMIKKIVFTENVVGISSALFSNCYVLKEIVFSKNLTSISSTYNMFYNCNSLKKLDFSKCISIPTLSNVSLPNAFCKIVVPDSLYNNWVAASGWSNYASYIVKASEYVE